MSQLGFIFNSAPHSTSKGREGLDALMAASAYCESIKVFFLDIGVTQLLRNQSPETLLQKDYIPTFKLMEMYDIEDVYVSSEGLEKYGLTAEDLCIESAVLSLAQLQQQLAKCDKVLTF